MTSKKGKPILAFVVLLLPLLIVAGCRSGPRNYLNENDKLRGEVLNQKRTIEKLENTLQLRMEQIATLQQQLDNKATIGRAAMADLPQVVSIAFDRLSGAIDTNGDVVKDTLRLYVKTLDQQGRFLPAAGLAEVQVVAIQPGKPPTVLASGSWTDQAFQQAYRTGLTGTHFTLEVDLPKNRPEGIDQVTVKLVFTDALTGIKVSCEQAMAIN